MVSRPWNIFVAIHDARHKNQSQISKLVCSIDRTDQLVLTNRTEAAQKGRIDGGE